MGMGKGDGDMDAFIQHLASPKRVTENHTHTYLHTHTCTHMLAPEIKPQSPFLREYLVPGAWSYPTWGERQY